MTIAHLPGTEIGFPVYCKAPEGLGVPLLGRTCWKASNDMLSLPVTWNLDQAWTGPEFPDPCLLECLPWMGLPTFKMGSNPGSVPSPASYMAPLPYLFLFFRGVGNSNKLPQIQ